MTNTLQTPFGMLTLQRRPHNPALQAWDAADEYLLGAACDYLTASATETTASTRTLVINDSFGMLACALHATTPVSWGDSFVAHRAAQQNWRRNELSGACELLPATATPSGRFDRVLWRVPKTQALFEQQIARLHGVIDADTVVLAGGMDKHLLPDTKRLLERLGRVDTLPGRKKSHLFRLFPDPQLPLPAEPAVRVVRVPELDLELHSDANVFARDQLDIGARFFIEQFAQLPKVQRVADLGCGNGVLALALARQHPQAEIHGFDESYQAIACARANWLRNIGESGTQHFHVGDGLEDGLESDDEAEVNVDAPFDLILCNPPFHQQHVVGDHLARQLFAQGQRHLAVGGELWIVGNRHLGYRELLRERFGNCTQVVANTKFVVLRAVRQPH